MPVTSARLADIPRRAFENSSKGLKDFPGASLEGDYERRIKQKSTCGRSWDWICSSLDIFWWLKVLGQRRVVRCPLTNRTVFNRNVQASQMEWQSQVRNLGKFQYTPQGSLLFPRLHSIRHCEFPETTSHAWIFMALKEPHVFSSFCEVSIYPLE